MKKLPLSLALGVLSFSSHPLHASAYQIWEQSANSVGYAHADMAALADDATTAWYNPAGMTQLCQPEISFGGTIVQLNTAFKGTIGTGNFAETLAYLNGNVESYNSLIETDAIRLPYATGNTTPALGIFSGVYPLHFSSFSVAFGLAVTAPWGLATNWRYSYLSPYATLSYMDSLQINPSVAFSYGDFSLGVGYGSDFVRTQLHTDLINFDGFIVIKNWENTWNIGALYTPNASTQFGITYRPSINHHLKGSSNFLATRVTTSHSLAKLPGTLAVGFKHSFTPSWSLLGTLAWSNWSRVKDFTVETGIDSTVAHLSAFSSSMVLATAAPTVLFNAKDTLFVAIGSKYIANENWILKCGFAWDQSPIRDKYREFRVPDNDHYHFAVGARYTFNSCVKADAGLQYIYVPKCGVSNVPVAAVPITTVDDTPDQSSPIPPSQVPIALQGYSGSITSSGIVFSIQASITFP